MKRKLYIKKCHQSVLTSAALSPQVHAGVTQHERTPVPDIYQPDPTNTHQKLPEESERTEVEICFVITG